MLRRREPLYSRESIGRTGTASGAWDLRGDPRFRLPIHKLTVTCTGGEKLEMR